MSETIKGYKAFGPGMVCRDKQYAENTIYEEPEAKLCERGMHYCTEPTDVLAYYPLVDENGDLCEFAEVEDLEPVGQKHGDDSKRVTKKLKINGKISFVELVKASINIEKITEESDIKCTDKNYAQIGSSGDYARIGSSGYYARIGSSGDYARIGSSGHYAQIGSSGHSAQIGSSGHSAQIGSSGYSARIGSSGDYAQIGSSGDSARIGSSGHSAQIGSSGYSARIGSSGYYARIGSSGHSAQIGSSGHSAQIGSSGDYARIGSSGHYAQIGSSGHSAQIGSSGDYARIGSSGENAVVAAIGRYSIAKAKKGSWIVLAEYDNSGKPLAVVSKQVDGEEIKEDTFYRLEDGRFTEVQL